MAKAFRLPNNQNQEFIFAARQIPKQIREIAYAFPLIAPKFFRKALKLVSRGGVIAEQNPLSGRSVRPNRPSLNYCLGVYCF
jgi:hypothetical protein